MMIVSGDKRLGGVLAYIEDDAGNPAPEADAFMDMLANNLAVYTMALVNEYNSMSEAEIEDAQQIANGNKPSAKSASLLSVNRNTGTVISKLYIPPLCQTEWDQGEGYWHMLNHVMGTANLTLGNAPVAMGQLMAYHEWPAKSSTLPQREMQNPFNTMKKIDLSAIDYDWDAMKAFPRATDSGMTLDGLLGINTLVYEAAINAGTQFGATESKTSIGSITQVFSRMGYDVSQSGLRPYSYTVVQDSLISSQPVIVSAAAVKKTTPITYKNTYTYPYTVRWTKTVYVQILWWRVVLREESWTTTETATEITYTPGNLTDYDKERVWVIDGCEVKDYQDTIQTSSGPRVLSRIVDYVHCNFGEGGSKNGWYKSGVFDINDGPVYNTQSSVSGGVSTVLRSTTSTEIIVTGPTTEDGTDGYYQYNMRIIPYLKPKYN
jgi:hypothetical protein